jgi:hypothetical protein
MTDKILDFPSMDDPDGDEWDYLDQGSDNNDSLLEKLFTKNERGEYERFSPDHTDGLIGSDTGDTHRDNLNDGIRAGEMEAYNKAKEIIGGDGESFQYFPDVATEENNRKFSMAHLQRIWNNETERNIGFANFFYRTFLNEGSQREGEHTGIASHYLMILAFYRAAREAEKFGKKMMNFESETGLKTLRFKGMSEVTKRKLGEKCCELASRVYSRAKNEIIKKHGGIHHR